MLDRLDARRRGEVLREKERLDARANLSAAELLKEQLKENAALSANGTTPNMWEGDARRLGTSEEDRIATAKKNIAAIAASKLWVDAHAPKLFTELLSPEQTNREVLHWLKAWDGIVFKRAPPKPVTIDWKPKGDGGGRGGGGRGDGGRGGGRGGGRDGGGGYRGGAEYKKEYKKKDAGAFNTHVPLDEEGRPVHKILLLSGAPGVGKTTLAHVAAKHAGYRVVEINASDDRNAETLKRRVTDACQMRSVVGGGAGANKPNCVVIDEIDGALGGAEGKGAIHALLQIVNGGKKSGGAKWRKTPDGKWYKNADEDAREEAGKRDKSSSGSGGSKKKKGPGPLNRPIIAICNDLYAPALRPLREIAKVFRVGAANKSAIASRLRRVCLEKGVRADARALTALVDRDEGDVRSCLNALQLLSSRPGSNSDVTLKDITGGGASGGEKDLTANARNAWTTLLSGHIVNRRTRGKSREAHNADLYAQCVSFGDDDLLMGGLFENLHSVKNTDASLAKTCDALTALGDADAYAHRGYSRGAFYLKPYVASCALAVHATVSNGGAAGTFLEWPQFGKVRREATRRRGIMRGWAASTSPRVGGGLAVAPDDVLADVIPYLLTTIAPEVRPVAVNFMKPAERELAQGAVETMASYALTYEEPPAGTEAASSAFAFRGATSNYVLDPPIETLCAFGGGVPGVNNEPGKDKYGGDKYGSRRASFGGFNPPSDASSPQTSARCVL